MRILNYFDRYLSTPLIVKRSGAWTRGTIYSRRSEWYYSKYSVRIISLPNGTVKAINCSLYKRHNHRKFLPEERYI